MKDPNALELPTTTREFAQWLRDIAEMVDQIPDQPLRLREEDVEIGFYYVDPLNPQQPTGLYFELSHATTL